MRSKISKLTILCRGMGLKCRKKQQNFWRILSNCAKIILKNYFACFVFKSKKIVQTQLLEALIQRALSIPWVHVHTMSPCTNHGNMHHCFNSLPLLHLLCGLPVFSESITMTKLSVGVWSRPCDLSITLDTKKYLYLLLT